MKDTENLELPNPARVRWQCRRGMLELDLLLLSFFDQAYATLSVEQQEAFVALLVFPDQELYEYLIGKLQPEAPEFQAIVQRIREHSRWAL